MNNKPSAKNIIISVVLYVLSGIILLTVIGISATITAEVKRSKDVAYSESKLYNAFCNDEYTNLYKYTAHNATGGYELNEYQLQYYYFMECYNAMIDYNMFSKSGQSDRALQAKKTYDDNYGKLKYRMFKDRLETSLNSLAIK